MDPDPYSLLFLVTTDLGTVMNCTLLLLLLISSALISGAEVAFFSLPIEYKEETDESSPKKRILVCSLLEKPKKLLATILVANNFINIAIVLLFATLFDPHFERIDETLALVLKIGVATFLILLFGEILPKVYASRNNEKFSLFMAYPLAFLSKIFALVSVPMSGFSEFIQEKLGKEKTNLSVDQLSQALELTSEEETTKDEQKILEGIVAFGNTDTKQVMQPRIDIFALDEEDSFQSIINEITKNGFSRIPVYKENIDSIVGVLYIKDVLPHISKKSFNWNNLLREPLFVPENKKLDDLLSEFQEKKVHLAIVVDEYGGTSGIITLEDIIEEIVGDISDEFDDDDLVYSKIDDKNYVFEGKTTLKDIYRVLKLEDESVFEDEKGEAETIAGFVLEISKGFPKKNDTIDFKNYSFTVEALDRKRLKQIKLTIK
ncbi:MAG: gliding motility-associated protein GldE [Flavobacteriaceae bacterium]|nr:gliding motility-associated protein GldE [Flavobacteriaceae bacterium]